MQKLYSNKAAWDAAAKPTDESTIGVLEDNNAIVFKGVNVLTNAPKFGDIVLYDSNKDVHFIARDSYVAATKPADWTPIGVVSHREGNICYITWWKTEGKKWADVYCYVITGISLDGTQHDCSVTLHSIDCGTFSYGATTIEAFALQLNSWLATHSPEKYPYSCYVEGDKVVLQLDNYIDYQQNNSLSGLTLTPYTGTELEANSNAYKMNGVGSEGGVFNMARCIEYFGQDISSATYNPEKDVTADTTYIVCKPAYLGTSQYRDADHCKWLRDKYGEGEEGWLNYLESMRVKFPNQRGVVSPKFADGKANTYALANVKYQKRDGAFAPKYPAANWCAGIGVEGVEQLEPGDFFMMSNTQAMNVYPKLTYGLSGVTRDKADPLNRGMNAIGGSAVSVTSYWWLSCRYNSYCSWSYDGIGYMYGNIFYNTLAVMAVSLYDLSKRKALD